MHTEATDVVVTGAAPSGAVAAALLRQHGHRVVVLERETFPRLSIGESLLPHSVTDLGEAGLRRDVVEAGFQHEDGAAFSMRGNAGEFLDPIFSSGVTIALTSASLAARCAHRPLSGEAVDWERDFAAPLTKGVDTFRVFIAAWYRGAFQRSIVHPQPAPEIRRMVCSILAGSAWDEQNPCVADPTRRLAVLEQVCALA